MKQYPECAYPLYTVARSGQLVRIGERVPWFSPKRLYLAVDRQKAAETGEKRSGYQPPTDSNHKE